jgi:hypothetical protein
MKKEELEAIKRRVEKTTPIFEPMAMDEPYVISADAKFIAHARTDVTALVLEVERLRGLLKAAIPHFDSTCYSATGGGCSTLAKILEALGEQ